MAFQQENAPVHNSILSTDYLTKSGINTVPHPFYSPDFAPCDFCLFPKLRGCRYKTIEEMKEAVTKVIGTLTQEDFDGTFQMLMDRYNKYIAAVGETNLMSLVSSVLLHLDSSELVDQQKHIFISSMWTLGVV